MTEAPKKRGRPKSEATKEREKIKEMLQNRPGFLPPLTKDQRQAVGEYLDTSEKIRLQMLKDHGAPPMPPNIVYAIESASPEFMTHEEIKLTQEEYSRIKDNIRKGQRAGGKTLNAKKEVRRQALMQKNPVLIGKLTGGNSSTLRVAQKLWDEWHEIKPHQRLLGEAHRARGDGLPKPSITTLRRWLS